MVEQPIYLKIFAWLLHLLPASFGAAISLKFVPINTTLPGRILAFLFGVGVASYFGEATISYFKLDNTSMVADSIIVAWAIFGMSIITQIYENIPDLFKELRIAFVSILSRIFGDRGGNP